MGRETFLDGGEVIAVPESWIRFVEAVESIAANFERYVDAVVETSEATKDALIAQTEMAQAVKADIDNDRI